MIVPTFGVVIPCYNQPKLMIRALYSVLAQTVASEVGVTIVSDGGTLAGQPEWLRVASTFENVTVLWTKNNGPGEARNAAIEWLLKTYPQIEYVFFSMQIIGSNHGLWRPLGGCCRKAVDTGFIQTSTASVFENSTTPWPPITLISTCSRITAIPAV